MKYDDMNLICTRCGKRYGKHDDEDCPDGTEGGFAPQELSTKGFQVGNWYRCIRSGAGKEAGEIYRLVALYPTSSPKEEDVASWENYLGDFCGGRAYTSRFDPTPVPGPIEPQRTPTEPDPNAWRSVCPYDPYGKAAHQAWLARQGVNKSIERICKVSQLRSAFNRVSAAAGCQASGEQLDHPIALGQPTEDKKPS